MNEKWIVIKNGTEQIWTEQKVQEAEKAGKIAIVLSIMGCLFLFIALYKYWITYTNFIDSIFRGFTNPSLWIGALLIVISKHLGKYSEEGKHAKEIREIKAN